MRTEKYDALPLYGQRVMVLDGTRSVAPHVERREVVAGRQPGLEEQDRAPRLGDELTLHVHLHVARRAQRVDALVRVAGVDEDLVVLLEPRVDGVPEEGDEVGDVRAPLDDLGVGPHGVLGPAVADDDRPVRGDTLARARRVAVGGFEQVVAHVAAREVVHGQVAVLEEVPGPLAVGDHLAGEDDAQPAGTGLDAHRPRQAVSPGRAGRGPSCC